MKQIIALITFVISFTAHGSTTDCKNLYIGRITVEKGIGLNAVVYLNNKGDDWGSHWSYFTGWMPEERKEALSMLLTAKAANHRVNIVTENADGCGLQISGTVTKSIHLTTNP